MQRTNIFLTEEQQARLQRRANEEGISKSSLIRRILDEALAITRTKASAEEAILGTSALWADRDEADMQEVMRWRREAPSNVWADAALRHRRPDRSPQRRRTGNCTLARRFIEGGGCLLCSDSVRAACRHALRRKIPNPQASRFSNQPGGLAPRPPTGPANGLANTGGATTESPRLTT